MSLIGGYYAFTQNKRNLQDIYGRLSRFHLLADEHKDDDVVIVYEHTRGHVFAKHKKGIRPLVSATCDKRGNLLFVLGFLTHDNWEDWNFNKGTPMPRACYPDDYADKLTHAEGEYTAIFAHSLSNTLHIVNDRFGARPLYYSVTDSGIYFCSNLYFLTQFCDRPIELDPIGLMQMFLYSHTAGQHTHLKHFERLAPATHLTVDGKILKHRTYWTIKYNPVFDLDAPAHARATFDEFQKSVYVRTRFSSRTALPLSGGLDSRLIAACVTPEMHVPTITMVSEKQFSSDQLAAAEMVSGSLSLAHSTLQLRSVISERSRDLIRLTGGLTPLQHSAKSIQGPYDQFDLVLDGGPGGVLAGAFVSSPFYALPKERDEIIKQYYNKSRCFDALAMFFKKRVVAHFGDTVMELLRHTLMQLDGDTAAERITLHKMIYRQPGFTYAQPPHNHPYGTSVYPHLGYGYVDRLLEIPPMWLVKRKFCKYMIYQCAPMLRHIPYANTGEFLTGDIGKSRASLIGCKLHAVKHRFGVLREKLVPPAPRASEPMLDYYHVQQDKQLLEELREMLLGYPEMADYFKIDTCISYINHFETGVDIPKISFSPDHPVGFLAAILYAYRYTRPGQNQF